MWGRSGAYAILAYNDLHEFARAYSGGKAEHMVDELDDAMTALRLAAAAVEKRVKASGKEVPSNG